ncbi:metallo-beta-lactamase superfamily protein [Asticcacaulis biprosthecium C19]|uniref:Metallo-beta-lactamase superfamily protein n=1 Tax=Asticcacaulis biprosthecium C19 TaxID=715226 RepID=F4QR22_9CAUL|nr:MBL fold metallo-hydrolase [Asticcacaulis biprosthecium]EGF90659.1 metallo-beta-lactamase superfamily protein [Asticcacaulis biprosthecium C19]
MTQTEPPIRLFIAPVTPLQQNCTVVWCTKTNKAAIIDPGGDLDPILEEIKARGLTVEKIWITHGHADHAGGAAELKERTGVSIEGPHEDDQFWIDNIPSMGQRYGIANMRSFTTDRWLKDGDTVTLGETTWDVIHCPGHTPGHVIFYHAPSQFAQVGDVLFAGSIGRTDFPRGNHADLIHSITQKLWPLGDVRFVPGHGPMSSFHQERLGNPFVGDRVVGKTAPNVQGPG